MAAGEVHEREDRERPGGQPAEVAAERDVREEERESEVEHDHAERRAAEDRDPAPLEDEAGAEDPEDRAARADGEHLGRKQERARGAAEQREEVDDREADPAEQRLERAAKPPEHQHVEPDVNQVHVQEAGGDQPVPLAVGDGGPVERATFEGLALHRARRAALGDLEQEDRDVHGDQRLRDDQAGRIAGGRPGALRRGAHAGRLPCALRALDPDRRLHHAVRADRAVAVRARDEGLAARDGGSRPSSARSWPCADRIGGL